MDIPPPRAEALGEGFLVVEDVRLRLAGDDGGEQLGVAVLDLVAQLDEELHVAAHGVVFVGVFLAREMASLASQRGQG